MTSTTCSPFSPAVPARRRPPPPPPPRAASGAAKRAKELRDRASYLKNMWYAAGGQPFDHFDTSAFLVWWLKLGWAESREGKGREGRGREGEGGERKGGGGRGEEGKGEAPRNGCLAIAPLPFCPQLPSSPCPQPLSCPAAISDKVGTEPVKTRLCGRDMVLFR